MKKVRLRNVLIPALAAGAVALGSYLWIHPGEITAGENNAYDRMLDYKAGRLEARRLNILIDSQEDRLMEGLREADLATVEFQQGFTAIVYDMIKDRIAKAGDNFSSNRYIFEMLSPNGWEQASLSERAARILLFTQADSTVADHCDDNVAHLEDWEQVYKNLGIDESPQVKYPVTLPEDVLQEVIERYS